MIPTELRPEGARTPGPWAVETPMGDETPWIVEAGKETYEWRCIAIVSADDPINDEDRDPVAPISQTEAEANAACNSHDQLVKALEDLWIAVFGGDELGAEPDVYADHDRLTELKRQTRAALRLARGEQP